MTVYNPKVQMLRGRSIFNSVETAKAMSKVATGKKLRHANKSVDPIHLQMALDTKTLNTRSRRHDKSDNISMVSSKASICRPKTS